MTTTLFTALVLVMAGLVISCFTAIHRTNPDNRAVNKWIAGFVALYLILPGVLAYLGVLDRWDPMPAPPFIMVAILTVITVTFAFSKAGLALVKWISLPVLIGFQAFRVLVEWLLHQLHLGATIPE